MRMWKWKLCMFPVCWDKKDLINNFVWSVKCENVTGSRSYSVFFLISLCLRNWICHWLRSCCSIYSVATEQIAASGYRRWGCVWCVSVCVCVCVSLFSSYNSSNRFFFMGGSVGLVKILLFDLELVPTGRLSQLTTNTRNTSSRLQQKVNPGIILEYHGSLTCIPAAGWSGDSMNSLGEVSQFC